MKFSLNSIRNFNQRYGTADDLAAIGIDKLIAKIGAQLGAIDEVVELGKKYQGIVIVKVLNCEPHPNADKLQLCAIDDDGAVKDVKRDTEGHIQVVCGAPNVKAGMLAAWLPPGTVVPETIGKEPFRLEAREIRGQVSNGMLASPKELGLGDSHAGLLEIEGDYRLGSDFVEAFGLQDDVVIDIENKMFTHRPDCFGLIGLSRELAGIQGLPFKSPAWYHLNPTFPTVSTQPRDLVFKNELPELVPRFMAITMGEVRVGPSPAWLQVELAKIGQKSINNIVDYTNFFMLETGQPLHAYDYDKVKALSSGEATIVVRHPMRGEKVKLLNGKQIEPVPEAIMIATDQQLIGVGGIMGGSETEVDETTTSIILEAGNFDMNVTRRVSMAHGLFTEAATRFTKGQSALQIAPVLNKIIDEIRGFAGGKVASHAMDDNHLDKAIMDRGSLHPTVKVSVDFINERLGLKLSADEMRQLLRNVQFTLNGQGEELEVTAPFWRTDIELREDVVEEVGRLYGYDHLPLELPKRDLTPSQRDPLFDTKAQIRARLSRAGANEVLTYSFVPGDLLRKVGQDPAQAFQVANALSPDLQYYRLSLMPSLLEKVHPNIKAGYDQFALFEIGRSHAVDQLDKDGLPIGYEYSALVITAADKLPKAGAAYYQARKYLESLVRTDLVFKAISDETKVYPVVQPYDPSRSALVSLEDGTFLGIIGEFRPSIRQALKLPQYTAGFEIDTHELQKLLRAGVSYQPLSRFPKVMQDITLRVPAQLDYQTVHDFVDRALGSSAPDDSLIELKPLGVFQREIDSKNLTFRVIVTALNRTLSDVEVNAVLDAVATAAKSGLDAERL